MFLNNIDMEVTVKNKDYVPTDGATEEVRKFIKRKSEKKKTQLMPMQLQNKKLKQITKMKVFGKRLLLMQTEMRASRKLYI